MDKEQQYWPILRRLETDLANRVRSFMVIGKDGEGVIVVTEDGDGYWLGTMQFRWCRTISATNPTSLNVPELVQMAQSQSHILLLNKRGEIYSMGQNDYGQLGLGIVDRETHFSFQLISIFQKFTSIRCGTEHNLALTEDGTVWAWGYNGYGQVGLHSSTFSFSSPRQISELDFYQVVSVECGSIHSLALTDWGEVYGWGDNSSGQLGIGSESSIHNPIRIHTPSPVQSMAAGYRHTLLLTQTGEVYACGWNGRGQLGIQTTNKFSASLVKVVGLPPIAQIASHSATNLSIAMSTDHRCFVWGELRDGTPISTPWQLTPVYTNVESVLSFFSSHRNTPHSVAIPAKDCSFRTDSTTQTEPYDFVPDQTIASSKQILDQMFDNPDSNSDVRFQVKSQFILAHQSVLQISSAHFRQLFSSSSVTPTPQSRASRFYPITNPSKLDPTPTSTSSHCPQVTISISDHSYPAFRAYLHFLYLGILEVSPEHLVDLFSLSVAYVESDLQQLCLSRMRTTLTSATCCLYYQLIHRHSLSELATFSQELVQFISTRTSEVYRTTAYQSMDAELCKKLAISIANLDT